jgi:hypothetical protein
MRPIWKSEVHFHLLNNQQVFLFLSQKNPFNVLQYCSSKNLSNIIIQCSLIFSTKSVHAFLSHIHLRLYIIFLILLDFILVSVTLISSFREFIFDFFSDSFALLVYNLNQLYW